MCGRLHQHQAAGQAERGLARMVPCQDMSSDSEVGNLRHEGWIWWKSCGSGAAAGDIAAANHQGPTKGVLQKEQAFCKWFP